jgi:subtilisin family serine protease
VTGVVALMLQASPQLKPADVRQILRETARVSDEKGNVLLELDDGSTPLTPSREFGHGVVDAAGAVEEALRKT